MRFGKRWMAFSLIAVILAAKLSTPLTPMTAMADEIVFVEDSPTNVEGSFFVEDVPEETVANGAVFETVETPETATEGWTEDVAAEIPNGNVSGTDGSADTVDSVVEETERTEDSNAEDFPVDLTGSLSNKDEVSDVSIDLENDTEPEAAESAEESSDVEEDLQNNNSASDFDIGETDLINVTEQNEITGANDSMTAPALDDSSVTEGEIFYTDTVENEDDTAFSGSQNTDGEAENPNDSVVTDFNENDILINDSVVEDAGGIPNDLFITEEGISETYIPIEDGIENSDNDDVFAAYVNREMELEGDVRADTGDLSEPVDSRKRLLKKAPNKVSGYSLVVFDILKEQIQEVASGNRSSTVFTVTLEQLGLNDMKWTASELGVDSIIVEKTTIDENGNEKLERKINQDALATIKSTVNINFSVIVKALLADCPYDLYWYDKTVPESTKEDPHNCTLYSGISFSANYDYIWISQNLTFSFPVASGYSFSGKTETYEVKPDIGQSVQIAKDNAFAIVERYSGKTDYEKIDGYRHEICDLVDYNFDAANNNVDYGDPWQLIWTFDDDPSTKVVCEGYSKSFQYLCDLSEFNDYIEDCISVTGKMNNSPHMWNIVSLKDGRNYLVDVTNCDSYKNNSGAIKYMAGAGNNGRDLFMIGTGSESTRGAYANGSIGEGYVIYNLNHNIKYSYDSGMLTVFDENNLTISEGRVYATITDNGFYEHIYLPVDAVEATFESEGHSAGGQCVLCGSFDDAYRIFKRIQHLSANDVILNYGATDKISVSGPIGELSFTSSNTSIATVDPNGKITGKKAGSAKITITASETEDYGETSKDITVTVKPLTIATGNVSLDASAQTYDGTEKKPAVTVKSGSVTFKSGTDYTVAYSNNTNAGTATVKVTGKGSCTGTVSKTFPIAAAKLTADSVTVATGTYTYNGKQHAPAVTVKYGNATLKKEADYSLTYANNINAGTAKVTVEGKGNYTGKVTKTYTIAPTAQTITAKAAASSIAVGKTTTISISGAKGTKTFKSSNTAIATVSETGKVTAKKVGTVKITAASAKTQNYKASSKTVTLKILPGRTSAVNAVNQAKGIKLTWAKVAGANGYIIYRNDKKVKTITKGATVTWADTAANTNGTKYVYKVAATASTGISPLSRTWTAYRIARPAIKNLKNSASKKMTVTWAKNAKSTGYQIQYALNSKFTSGLKKVSITKAATVTRVIKSLIKGKTYYVRIRTVKKVGNHAYYSVWSPVKALKISK